MFKCIREWLFIHFVVMVFGERFDESDPSVPVRVVGYHYNGITYITDIRED